MFRLLPRSRPSVSKSRHNVSVISVVIPAYNGASYIGDALNSVYKQAYLPSESLVVDDCSLDSTVELTERLVQSAPVPLRVLRMPKNSGGPCGPLNAGIRAAKGNWIAVLEQDDLMRPRRLEAQVEALSRHSEAALCIGRYEVFGAPSCQGLPWYLADPQFADVFGPEAAWPTTSSFVIEPATAFRALLRRNFTISNSNFCFAKRVWERVSGFDPRVRTVSDLCFVLRTLEVGPLAVANEVTLDYRWGAQSLNRAVPERVANEMAQVLLAALRRRPEWAGDQFWDSMTYIRSIASRQLRRGNALSASRLFLGTLLARTARKLSRRCTPPPKPQACATL